MFQLQTILHPTDFSPLSDSAFRLACSLARDHGASVVVLHVMRPPMAFAEPGIIVPAEDNSAALLAELQRIRSPHGGALIEHRLEEGSPAREIVRVAEETACDLIVMATHGRRGVGRLFMGSVAEKVMREAPCPVLTIKAPLRATARQWSEAVQPAGQS